MIHRSMQRSDSPCRNYTPFPNKLLDSVMPSLGDTSWRILCLIVRQTCGWHDGVGRRKSSDWISHSQLKRRTGRQGAAVSRGIDALCKRGLIMVQDSSGRHLITPAGRRRSRSPLYYSLAGCLPVTVSTEQFGSSKSKDDRNGAVRPPRRRRALLLPN